MSQQGSLGILQRCCRKEEKDLVLSYLVQLNHSPSNHRIHKFFLNREEERTREGRKEERGQKEGKKQSSGFERTAL